MSRPVRCYRRLLSVYPASFRADYADEMTRLFAEQLDDAAASDGPRGVVRVWTENLLDLALTAPGQHIRREEPVPRPAAIGSATTVVGATAPGVGPRIALSLLPLWLVGFLVVAAPGFMDPVFSNPPAVLGLPAGAVLVLVALAWMALGALVIRRTASFTGVLLAFLVFTAPAAIAAVFIPAVILILLNLAV